VTWWRLGGEEPTRHVVDGVFSGRPKKERSGTREERCASAARQEWVGLERLQSKSNGSKPEKNDLPERSDMRDIVAKEAKESVCCGITQAKGIVCAEDQKEREKKKEPT